MNNDILQLLEERLKLGQKRYGQDVPLEDDRDFVEEALEELLDSIIYLTAQLLRIRNTKKL